MVECRCKNTCTCTLFTSAKEPYICVKIEGSKICSYLVKGTKTIFRQHLALDFFLKGSI